MARSSKFLSKAKPDDQTPAQPSTASQIRKANHLKDEVYRQMLRLEASRPGAEMGLALALLRAIVQTESLTERAEHRDWLKAVCPVGLRMIEAALEEGCKCELNEL